MPHRSLQTSRLVDSDLATLPEQVAVAPRLSKRDTVCNEGNGNEGSAFPAEPWHKTFEQALEGTLSEWSSTADTRTFCDLEATSPLRRPSLTPGEFGVAAN